MKKLIILISLLLGVAALFLFAYFYVFFLNPGRFDYDKVSLAIRNKIFSVEIADTMPKRAQGLSGRTSFGESEGMLFIFKTASSTHNFWMKDMRIPLDIVWIRGTTIVGFAENAEPEPEKPLWGLTIYYPPEPVDKVLEINAGLVKKYGFAIGDKIDVKKR